MFALLLHWKLLMPAVGCAFGFLSFKLEKQLGLTSKRKKRIKNIDPLIITSKLEEKKSWSREIIKIKEGDFILFFVPHSPITMSYRRFTNQIFHLITYGRLIPKYWGALRVTSTAVLSAWRSLINFNFSAGDTNHKKFKCSF